MPIVEIIEYPDYEAYRAFFYFIRRRNPAMWFSWILLYGVLPAISVYLVIISLRAGSVRLSTLICLVGWTALAVYRLLEPRIQFKKRGSSFISSRAAFFEEYFAFVTTRQASNHESAHRYEDVESVHETGGAFYILHNGQFWSFVPKKFMAPEQIAALRELFTRKFGPQFKSKA